MQGMKVLFLVLLIVGVAVGAFVAGRHTATQTSFAIPAAPIAAVKSVFASSEPTQPIAPKPTQFDRELMSSLNAIQSSVETGVNSSRYSELIGTARTKLADLKLYSPESPLVAPTEQYLYGHKCVLSIWSDSSAASEVIYVSQDRVPELYDFAQRAAPHGRVMKENLPNRTYEVRGGIGVLWGYTEGELWRGVMGGWQELNRTNP